MTRPPAVHYLRYNKGERTPHRVLVVDCEAAAETAPARELQTLRLWSARLIRRHGREPARPAVEDFDGETAAELLAAVTAANTGGDTLWVFTHNLSYDLGLTRLPLQLLGAGYQLGRHNLASDAPWAYLKRGARGLRLADSWSWLPVSVDTLGLALGIAKPALPAETDDMATWRARCRADVNITATALCRLMDTWDASELGWWSLTGPASGWNSMLHMATKRAGGRGVGLLTHSANPYARSGSKRVLIHPDPDARSFERQAIYSGRRDLWRVGKLPRGPYAEVDFRTAHLAVCAHMALPYRRWAPFNAMALDDWRLDSPSASLLASVVVTTETPRYPYRVRGAILHPVGTFETVLAGPEIRDARDRGALVSIGHGYGYHLGPHMQEWSQWALGILGADAGAVDPLFKIMVKGWSRTVPGRWGMTIAREIAKGPSHVEDWALEPALVGTPPRRGFILHVAGEWSEHVRDQEAEDSFPAVLAHIQSWTRLLLGRALDAVGERDLVSCNTEGFWMQSARLAALAGELGCPLGWSAAGSTPDAAGAAALSSVTAPLTARVKTTAATLALLSPQHLEIDGARHYAGVPRAAVALGDGRYEFWTWPKLAGQIERGDPRGYVRELRRVDLSGLPVNRWAYADGCCEPVQATWCPESGTVLLRPGRDGCGAHGASLAATQHPALRGLL